MKKMVTLLLLGCCSLFANENMHFSSSQSFNQQVSSEDSEKIQIAIAANTIDDKYYTIPGSIYVGSQGIFVNIAGTFIQVNHLAQDDQGIYVPAQELYRMIICANCGRTYNPTIPHKCSGKKR